MQKFFRLPLALVFTLGISMIVLTKLGILWPLSLPFSTALAVMILVAAIGIVLSAAYVFKKAQTTFDPRTPEKSSSLVVIGIFRFSRNPMYLGFLLVLLATAIYFANAINFLFLPAFVILANRWYIQPEEKALSELFGQEYKIYLSQVRRWI